MPTTQGRLSLRRPRSGVARRRPQLLIGLVAVGVALLLSATAVAAGLSFAPATNYSLETSAYSVATGDLNGDGVLDIVATGFIFYDRGKVSVLLGAGDGSFGPVTTFDAGVWPIDPAIGDLNGDGIPDLAVANVFGDNGGPNSPPAPGTVSILLGTGGGSFGPATSFLTGGGRPFSVAMGDLNNDGKLDLAIANSTSDTVSTLLGMGDGTFGPAAALAVSDSCPFSCGPDSVTIGDLNSDGRLDLLTTNGSSDNVSVFLGIGGGSFGPVNTFGLAGLAPFTGAIGDVNGDGKPDVVTANENSGTVSILLGTGTGSFNAATTLATGANPSSVAIGDFDGDGVPDLAVTHNTSASHVSVHVGVGAGNFGPGTDFPVGNGATSVATGDFDGSGTLDLVTADVSFNVSVLLNTRPAQSFQSITFGALADVTVGSPSFNLTASASSGLPVSYSATGPCSVVGSTVSTSDVGPCTVTASQAGNAGWAAAADVSQSFNVVYAPSGTCAGAAGHAILQPINADGTSVFKQGSTVPAKFRVCDANGTSIGTPGLVTSFKLVQVVGGTVVANVDEAVLSTTPDSAFRWSATDSQWIFNIATKSLSPDKTYFYRITLNDGSHIDFHFGLR